MQCSCTEGNGGRSSPALRVAKQSGALGCPPTSWVAPPPQRKGRAPSCEAAPKISDFWGFRYRSAYPPTQLRPPTHLPTCGHQPTGGLVGNELLLKKISPSDCIATRRAYFFKPSPPPSLLAEQKQPAFFLFPPHQTSLVGSGAPPLS